MTFTVVGTLADFGTQPRAGVRVRANGVPTVKVDAGTVYSDTTETTTTDAAGTFTLTLHSVVGLWYTIRTDYGATSSATFAGYVPDTLDPTTGTALPDGTVIDLADVVTEDPTPGYAVTVGPPGPPWPGGAYFQRRPAGGAVTTGDVILLGSDAHAPTDVGTALVAGGAPLYENVVGGNPANVGTGTSNLTGAPALTGQNGNWDFILAGYDNVVNGSASIVSGYHCTVGVDGSHNTVGGGSFHTIAADVDYSTISGGTEGTVTGSNATIGGGRDHTAGVSATVAGGSANTSSGVSSSVGGGYTNGATGDYSTIGGGNTSTAAGNAATVGGGQSNTAAGQGATVPGGRDNTAAAAYSVATGRGAATSITGQRAHASVPFVTAGDAQESVMILKRQTTDATVTLLTDGGGSTAPTMPALSTNAFTATVVARRTDVEGDHAAFKATGCYARHVSGSVMVGTPTITSMGATAGAATWAVAVTFSSGRLVFNVTGEAAKTIRWVCRLELTQVVVS